MRGVFAHLLLLGLCVGCSNLEGLTGGGETPPGTPESGGGKEGTNADACSGDQCLPSPADVIYVAEGGNDTNDGKSGDKPKRTIGGAIALLKTTGAPNFEVHVCRGTYPEAVVLDYATSIRGGYECSTWKRAQGNETIIAAPAGSPGLTVQGVAGVTVDGLTIRGSDANATARSVGVLVGAGAAVKLTADRIVGGGGTTKLNVASAGVYVENGGAVEIEKSFVEGGSATLEGGGYGSAGVAIALGKEHDASSLKIIESEIRGGSGTVSTGTGSIGVLAFYGTVSAIERSVLYGGTGKSSSGTASAGASVSGKGDLSFVSNKVDGGSGTCVGSGSCSVYGAGISPEGVARIHGNRIIGGEVNVTGGEARFTGLVVTDSTNADIQNNQIFTGNTKHEITSMATALEVTRSGTVLVGQNTLVVGSTLAGTGSALVLDAKQGTVANNLFLAATGAYSDHAVRVSSCKDARIVSFRNNVWAGFDASKPILGIDKASSTAAYATCTAAATTATASATAESALTTAYPGITVAGNQRITATVATLLGAWNEANANDLFGGGWKLAPTATCSVVKGSGDVGGLAPTDAFGATRTDPRSIGATESDGACQ